MYKKVLNKVPTFTSINVIDYAHLSSVRSLLILCCLQLIFAPSLLAQQALTVDVVYPTLQEKNQTIMLPRTVQARQDAQLAAVESGRVEALLVEVGDEVLKGQVLLRLDSQLAKLALQVAEAEVKAAELTRQEAERLYQEVQKLSAQKVVAKTLIAERAALLSNAKAQLARVKASFNLQQERLNRHRLMAPFDGVIAHRNVDVGEWITPQSTVLTLVAQNDLRLAVQIPQQYYTQLYKQVKEGVAVRVLPDVVGSQPFNATISRLVPVSDTTTRTFAAQIDIPGDDDSIAGQLVTGMSAMVELIVPDSEYATVVLPRAAIKQHPDGNSSVFVVDNNTAKRVVTDYVMMPNGQVAVHNQPPDQGYIVTGVELLRDGSPIVVTEVESPRQ